MNESTNFFCFTCGILKYFVQSITFDLILCNVYGFSCIVRSVNVGRTVDDVSAEVVDLDKGCKVNCFISCVFILLMI